MTHASVFSGIGGPEVAATMLGWENLFHCEINPFGRRVLDYWYPNSKSYEDITTTDFTEWRGRVNVLTGGFPCQPFSYAGKRGGAQDDRYLWPYMFRCIDQVRPDWVVAENVAGILTMVEQGEVSEVASAPALFDTFDDVRRYQLRETFTLQRICDDLESHGYAVQPVLVPACGVGAPHRRDRVFIIGHRIDTDTEDSMHIRREQRQYGEQGHQRNERDTRSGDEERVHPETDAGTGNAAEYGHAADTIDEGLQGRHDCDTEGHGQDSDGCTRQLREVSMGERPHTDTSNPGRPMGGIAEGCRQHDSNGTFEHTCRRWIEMSNNPSRATSDERRGIEETERTSDGYEVGDRWRNFPTQSPIHRGNDGIPFDVDGLALPWVKWNPTNARQPDATFNKWRTEALKAYGNAIVPQVMYEIFRAIQQVEQDL